MSGRIIGPSCSGGSLGSCGLGNLRGGRYEA